MPGFGDFYDAVHERSPFPWQARLAGQVREQGNWPTEVGVPTGLGKTACLDIAVWWLASQAHLPPGERSAPTRIWWVVNRRLLVDEASKHAERLKKMLLDPRADGRTPQAQETLASVARRLRSLTGALDGAPLYVAPMRGGITLRRPPNPAQPSVIVSTIPMYGSRLLFRGFGSSRSMRPIDAAHAGTDSLVIVDEAHLARHLRDLIPKLKQCTPGSADNLLPAYRSVPQVVSLTATGDASVDDRFDLDQDDLKNEIVRRRLNAHKTVEVDAELHGDTAKALRDSAVRLLEAADLPASCVIFCNTPAMAREVQSLVAAHRLGGETDLMTVTGRVRQPEADALRERLLSPTAGVPASVDNSLPERQRHLVVVATQTLEVGADLDFEYLVTEQCGVRALTQRLGRLNRLGRYQHARAVYVHRPPPRRPRSSSALEEDDSPPENGWPVYGKEPTLVLKRFERRGFEDVTDLSPRVIADRLGEPADDPGRAPEVLPDLLWEWVKTTTPPHGEAPVEPYFSGISDPQRSVSVLWRVLVPHPAGHARESATGEVDESEATDERVRLWPKVHNDETVEVPAHELRATLHERGIDTVSRRSSDENFIERARPSDLRPGDLVILPADIGMHDEFGWAPDSREPVADLSIKRSGLPLDAIAIGRLFRNRSDGSISEVSDAITAVLGDEEEPDNALAVEAADHLIALLRDQEVIGFERAEWNTFLDSLDPNPVRPPREIQRLETRARAPSALVDESDEVSLCWSLPPQAMELVAHGDAVGARASETATTLGLPKALTDVIHESGRFHDIGKADNRFQRSLRAGSPVDGRDYVPLAKSRMPMSLWPAAQRDAGWPRGGRHEELSARLVRAWLAGDGHILDPAQQDLLVHLVVSHHGKGRPLVVPVGDGSAEPVEWRFADDMSPVRVSADLSETDWSQPARFWRLNQQHGPWGLALLEAVVRQADHEVSAASEVQ